MKKLFSLFFIAFPFLAFGQIKMEIYGTAQQSVVTNSLIEYDWRITPSVGIGFTAPTKNPKLKMVGGIQLSTFGNKYETELRWGSQHDGQGGFEQGQDDSLANSVELKKTHLYLEAPIGIRYFLLEKKVKLFVQPTIAPVIYLTTKKKQTLGYPNGDSEETNFSDRDRQRPLNFHTSIAAGIQFPLSEKANLLLMPYSGFQILNLYKNSQSSSFMYTYGLRAGLQFRL